VLAYSVTAQHVGQRVTLFPPDGDTARPATAEEYPRRGCGAGGVATVTAHGVRLSSPPRVGLRATMSPGPLLVETIEAGIGDQAVSVAGRVQQVPVFLARAPRAMRGPIHIAP
jgi:hypothetical protein